MAAERDIDLSSLQSQDKIMEVKTSIQVSEEESKKELEVLWSRVKATATLLTYLKSKARAMAVPDLAHVSCGIKQLEGVDEETWMGITRDQDSLDELDGAYIGELPKSVKMVTDLAVLVKMVIMADSETAIEKEKVTSEATSCEKWQRDFESLKSYASSLISVRETLLSSEKQFQTMERLFEWLVAKAAQLEVMALSALNI
ncbi:hypothetical protein SLA2020_184690 [Shorea laevis]